MRWWAIVLVAAACAPAADDPAARCTDDVAEYRAIARSLDESCRVDDDCVPLGASSDCEGGELSIWAGAVNEAAYATVADRLTELTQDIVAATGRDCGSGMCGDDLCTGPDLGPQHAECVNHHCWLDYPAFCNQPSCETEVGWYSEVVASLDRSCAAPGDCAVVGGPQGCKCAPSLTGDGEAVNAAALAAHQRELDELAATIRGTGAFACELLVLGSCGPDLACRCGVGATSASCDQGACVLVYDELCPKE